MSEEERIARLIHAAEVESCRTDEEYRDSHERLKHLFNWDALPPRMVRGYHNVARAVIADRESNQ